MEEREDGQRHWDAVYAAREEAALTWFEAQPRLSFDLVSRHLRPGQAFIDIGGGASRLVDRLLDAGQGPLTVLDLSEAALAASRERLGARAGAVTWIRADVTRWKPPRRYQVWHDRAAFHFLIEPADRAAYVAAMADAVQPGGVAILETFAEDGPETCSGLSVARYSPDALAAEIERLGPGAFGRIESGRHVHITPKGNRQSFQYSVFRRGGADA